MEEMTIYLLNTYCDLERNQELGPNDLLITQKPPKHELNTWTLTWKELQEVVRASRSVSSPGLSPLHCIETMYRNTSISVKIVKSDLEKRQNCRTMDRTGYGRQDMDP